MKPTVTGAGLVLLLAILGLCPLATSPPVLAAESSTQAPKKANQAAPVPGSEIFDHPKVLDFQVKLGETNLQALRRHPREYTPVTVVVNGREYHQVGVKLKGAAGSFRPVDDTPALTLHFSKWLKGQRVFGLRRLHLNNSVQDDSRMNEYIGSGLFREAGVPTPRVAWATVRINERDLGLYVLIEAFETDFLRLFFHNDKGNLYEGGFVKDIEQGLAKESGKGPDDNSDVQALCAAMREKDTTNRWERLNRLLDVDLFTTYAALSVMLVDWDGYPMNRNNYRVYFRPKDGKAVFMPHGMDQLFQRTDYELDASWTGTLAWALFDTPQGQALYQQRCREVFTNVFRLERITNTIAQVTELLRKTNPNVISNANDLTYRVERRYRSLSRDEFLKPPHAAQTSGTSAPAGAAPQ